MHALDDAVLGTAAPGATVDHWWATSASARLPTYRARTEAADEEAYDFVADAAATVAELLPGLGFLAPGGLLEVPVDPGRGKVATVRLELPPGEPLRLQSIRLTAEGGEDLSRTTTLSASSWHDGTTPGPDLQALFAVESPSGVLVHTGADTGPAWVELRLARPTRLSGIAVRNVGTPEACCAYGLRISTTSRFRKPQTVHDGSADLRDLDVVLGLVRAVAATNPLLAALIPPLELTLRGHYPAARAALDELALPATDRARFVEALNTELLDARGDTWVDEVRAPALGSAA